VITFEYTARDKDTGESVKAEVEAQSEQAAAKLLINQNLLPLTIIPKGSHRKIFKNAGTKVRTKDRILYTRQLATLINAGLPLTQALRTVGEQTPNKRLQLANSQIISAVEGGERLSDSFAKHPNIFNNVYIQLIAAGEASGTLDESLLHIAMQQEKDAAVLAKIRGAMVYPVIVVVVIVLVLVFMLTTVVPQIKTLYDDIGKQLPLVTRILIWFSELITNWWFLLIPFIVIFIYASLTYTRTEGGRLVIDKLKMRIPLFGKLFMKLYMARFSRIGATLLGAGVPMLEMMGITAQSISNIHVERAIQEASIKVKGGTALSAALENRPEFLPLVPQMIGIGEKSGAIEDMLAKTATYFEDELDNQIRTLSTIIEPALMVVLALMAAVVIGAILLPVYGLVGQSLSL
jgi:type IV pilus assembly protein PilC